MKRITLILLTLGIVTINAFAQNDNEEVSKSDTIGYESIYWSARFYHQGYMINLKEVSNVMKSDPTAHSMLSSARTLVGFSYVMAGSGGFILGYNLNNENEQLRKKNLAIGGGLAAGGLLLSVIASSKAKAAIDLYNSNLKNKAKNDISLSLGLSNDCTGIGLTLCF